jgi:radical SAM superfamily enzyme YgiQ (UPF0313 family)
MIPPLSLVYIATSLKERFKIKIIDQRVDENWRNVLEKELLTDTVICTGISSMTGPQISGGIETASIIKKVSPGVPVIWGGVHPSLLPEETIKNEFVDIIVIGDGEETFGELVEVLRAGGDKKSVRGIIYKDGDSVVRTPERGQFPISKIDMDCLAIDLIDMERYKSTPLWTNRKSLPIITSRGCPYRCSYCYNIQFSNRRWTSLSPEETVSSIIKLVKRYDISGIFVLDDNFFVNLKRVRRICELLIEKNLNISIYNANCRVDTLVKIDDDFMELIRRAGFNQIYIGVESGSDEVLRKIKKDITLDQVFLVNQKMKRAGIRPFYSFMAGFPFETVEDIKKTLELMRLLLKINPDAIVYRLQLFTPFPGTDLFNYSAQLGMNFPKSLEEWYNYHYDRINYDKFNEKHKKFLEDFYYYTSFLDSKLSMDRTQYIKFISNIYSRILNFRLDHGFYGFTHELYPLKIGQRFLNTFVHRCSN